MSIKIDDGSYNSSKKTIYVDTSAEIANLRTDYAVGSIAFVINESKMYMLNNAKEWKEI